MAIIRSWVLVFLHRSIRACPGCLHNRAPLFPDGPLVFKRSYSLRCSKTRREPSQWRRIHAAIHKDEDGGSLVKTAGVIGVATAVSKVIGLIRELVLAAVFGVGPVIDAFGYASIVPGFFVTILGGINGPIHVSMVSILSKLPGDRQKELVKNSSRAMLMISTILSVLIYGLADRIVDAFAPGLLCSSKAGSITRSMAIVQLRVMTPCVILACLMGIGYGTLSTSGKYGIASLSPTLSSITIMFAAAVYCRNCDSSNLLTGAILLAVASSLGALFQWLIQALASEEQTWSIFRWENPFANEDVKKVLFLMMPAVISSGMLQIATYTDLYFASYFPKAAAALGYANLLVMAPLGIISSAVLLPLLPLFSNLSEPSNWTELGALIRQGVQLCMTLTLAMTAIFLALAKPIVQILFQRYAFDDSAVQSVSSLVKQYALGSTSYLMRDLFVRVFYALGDGKVPFCISSAAIIGNALLDWFLVGKIGLGPDGLVLATSIVNFLSAAVFWQSLSHRIQDLNNKEWTLSLVSLLGCAVLSTIVTEITYKWIQLHSITRSSWTNNAINVGIASCACITPFLATFFDDRFKQLNHSSK